MKQARRGKLKAHASSHRAEMFSVRCKQVVEFGGGRVRVSRECFVIL